jgi:hypothetical protein
LQQVQQLDHLQQQQQQQIKLLLLLSFLSSAWFLKSNQKHTPKKKGQNLQLQVLTATGGQIKNLQQISS